MSATKQVQLSSVVTALLLVSGTGPLTSQEYDNVNQVKKHIFDYLFHQLKYRYKYVQLNNQNIENYSVKQLIEIITAWGDFHSFSAPLKSVILALFACIKKRVLSAKKSHYFQLDMDDIYLIEMFYCNNMKNNLSLSWSRNLQEFLCTPIHNKEPIWSSFYEQMDGILSIINGYPQTESSFPLIPTNLVNSNLSLLHGWGFLHYICAVNDNLLQNMSLLKEFLSRGCNMNAVDYKKQTPLHVACSQLNYAGIMNLCSLRGINKALPDIYGRIPLQTFLETLTISSKTKFLTVDRISAVIKELLPNNNPLSLWEIWPSCSVDIVEVPRGNEELPDFNNIRRGRHCGIVFIVASCNVSIGYEMLNLSLPLLSSAGSPTNSTALSVSGGSQPSTSPVLLIILELFVIMIKKNKNSFFNLLLQYVLNSSPVAFIHQQSTISSATTLQSSILTSKNKNEFYWNLNNFLMTIAIFHSNYEVLALVYEQLFVKKCEMNSFLLLELQQSLVKRSTYLLFFYFLVLQPIRKDTMGQHASNSTNNRLNTTQITDNIIKQMSVLLGQHLFTLGINNTTSVHNHFSYAINSFANQNWEQQLQLEIKQNVVFQFLFAHSTTEKNFSSIVVALPTGIDSHSKPVSPFLSASFPLSHNTSAGKQRFQEFSQLLFCLDNLSFFQLTAMVGHSVFFDSLFRRIFSFSKSSSKQVLERPTDEFSLMMKKQYSESIVYSYCFHQLKSLESIRNSIGYNELGQLVFHSGDFVFLLIIFYLHLTFFSFFSSLRNLWHFSDSLRILLLLHQKHREVSLPADDLCASEKNSVGSINSFH
jgi:hypothetical protein